nr:tetraacyldisaccharide 4'-kinase [uncultured Psychroserpens sp.]
MKLLRKILLPIVPIYYFVTWLRNKCYDMGLKSSKSYKTAVICVGNLSTGGTGKTPTIEYLIRLLSKHYEIATLSRGYKRETQGFIIANEKATAKTIGDEPYQFYHKFKDVVVSVDANRQNGIEKLMALKQPEVILLDDAFQHRKVKAGLNILLTSYNNLYCDDIVLPTGNLREPRAGAKRADLILVTKCPNTLSSSEMESIKKKLNPLKEQKIYFSSIAYDDVVKNSTNNLGLDLLEGKKISLVTGIANPQPLVDYLTFKSINFEHLRYSDHHVFTNAEIDELKQKEFILTTEKDFVRLKDDFRSQTSKLWYLPISFKINDESEFDTQILSFVKSFYA